MKHKANGQFIRGDCAESFNGFGIWFSDTGYPLIWINNKNIKLHVYVWELQNGEKPKGYDVHHIDFNKRNYRYENLELLSLSDHKRVHAGWVKENGEWAKKPCTTCKQFLPLAEFYKRKGSVPTAACKSCHRGKTKIS